VRVIERQDSRPDEHFTEGEPDLEAPEELAVLEVDEETALEEDLDGHVDHEDEVDEAALEISLDHLVYDGDEDDEDAVGPVARLVATILEDPETEDPETEDPETDDPEIEDLEDREESLDRILREKLAGDEDGPDDPDDLLIVEPVTGEGPEEFVCPSCFLVRSQVLRSGPGTSVCRDCGG